MSLFRLFLLVCLITILVYTADVIANHGWNLMQVFFGAIAERAWPGQFNVDFTCFLALSALWVSWRHQFSAAGLLFGVVAFFGGMLFLSIYLLIHTGRSSGDVKKLLLGEARAA